MNHLKTIWNDCNYYCLRNLTKVKQVLYVQWPLHLLSHIPTPAISLLTENKFYVDHQWSFCGSVTLLLSALKILVNQIYHVWKTLLHQWPESCAVRSSNLSFSSPPSTWQPQSSNMHECISIHAGQVGVQAGQVGEAATSPFPLCHPPGNRKTATCMSVSPSTLARWLTRSAMLARNSTA